MRIEHQNDKLLIGAVMLIAGLVAGDVACKNQPPASTPTDVGNLVSCVEGQLQAGDTNVVDIAEKCGGAEVAVVEDIISALLAAQNAPAFAIKPVDGGVPLKSHIESH